MEKTTPPRRATALATAVLLLLALGTSLFLAVLIQSPGYSVLRHEFRLDWYVFVLWAAAFALLYAGRRDLPSWLPLAAFLVSPFLLRYYWTRDDLRLRLAVLAVLVLASVAVLKSTGRRQAARRPPVFRTLADGFGAMSGARRLPALFLASYLVYQLAGFVLVSRGATFTGDEPFYLMTTASLYKDGDINIANNYAQQDYFSFYSREDFPRLKLGIYGREGRRGKDYVYPINLPGISVLLLPFYWLSRLFSGRWLTFVIKTGLSAWASLLGLQLYLYARGRWDNERLSLGLWALYAFSAPVLFFAVHLYPEVPAACLMFIIFRKLTGRRPPGLPALLALGVLLGLLPWLGLKFSFFFWALLAIGGYFLVKEGRGLARPAAFALPALVSMALFYLFVHDLYGTFSPIAVYEGVMAPGRAEAFKQTLLEIPLRARLETFLDYFLDQRDGLLLYSPVYFFVFLGLVEIWRHRRRDLWCFLIIALPFLLNYALFTHRQGASPQGRVLAPLTWIGAIAIGEFLVRNRKPVFAWLFGGAAAAGLGLAGLLLANPTFLYQPTTHEFTSRPGDLFVHLGNIRFFLPALLPSFIKVDNTRYWPNYAWPAALLALVLVYAFSRREKPWGPTARTVAVGAGLAAAVCLWVLYPKGAVFPVKTIAPSPQREFGFTAYPTAKGVIARDTGEIYLHAGKPYRFFFSSRAPFEKLRLAFGSEKGDYDVRLRLFDLPLLETRTSRALREFVFEPRASTKVRNLYVYEIGVDLEHLSRESMQLDPFFFQLTPLKN